MTPTRVAPYKHLSLGESNYYFPPEQKLHHPANLHLKTYSFRLPFLVT